MSASIERLEQDVAGWVGRQREDTDRVLARPAQILAASFDRDLGAFTDGEALPPAWHWLYFHEVVALSELAPDGHAAKGDFLPPIALPRRMWAGNRMQFHRPLRVQERVRRVSTVTNARVKSGASGVLVFVTVRHELSGEDGIATVEEHDIVYRSPPSPDAPSRRAPPVPDHTVRWQRTIVPSPVLLFRFSALTMNSHRIHYDRDYCKNEEGYPGLLVHGPLTMLLLLDLFTRNRPHSTVQQVSVRATSPLYDTAPFSVNAALDEDAGQCSLWAATQQDTLAMSAELSYRD